MSLWIAITYIVGTILAALISPFLGLIGLIGGILIRFQDRFPVLETYPTFLFMAFACILGFFLHRKKLGNADYWPDKYWKWFAGWVFLGLLIKAPSSLMPEIQFLLSSMVMYYFCSRSLTSEGKYLFMFFIMIAISVGMGYETTISYLTEPNSEFAYMPNEDERRMIGLGRYSNANEFGAILIMPMGMVFGLVMLSRSIFIKTAAIAAGAFLVYATGLTYSRTCMALFGIMAMTAGALWGKGNAVKKVIVLGAVGGLLFTFLSIIPGPIQERFMSILNFNQDESFLGRQRAWEQGFHMVRNSPLFGVGMSQWPEYHGKAPHNSFVQAMAETGFVGIAFYVMALFYALKVNLRVIEIPVNDPRYNPRTRILAICLTATLVGYMVYAFFGNQAYTPFMYIYAGLCAGIANLVKVTHEKVESDEPDIKGKGKKKKKLKGKKRSKSLNTHEIAVVPEAESKPRFPQAPR